MNHITLTGLDPRQLAELEQNIKDQLAHRSAQVSRMDNAGWYELAMRHAAEIVALEFSLARGE